MQSISVFNCQSGFDIKKLKNFHSDHQEKVNGQNEKLTTNLWDDKNKDKNRIYRYRSYARKFIRDLATDDDLKELDELIHKRLND